MTAQERIEALLTERRQLWQEGRPAETVEKALDEAWADARRERAAASNGDPMAILVRARIEQELEKLMTGEE